MIKRKNGKYAFLATIGLILFVTGLILIKFSQTSEGMLLTLPYIFVGVGMGIFGHNLGELMKNIALAKDPEAAKQIEIEANDERNIAISHKAKAKAYDAMLLIFGALMLVFALMQVNLNIILTFVAAYLLLIIINIYYLRKFQKEM
ncbi:hypothetical protein KHM83_11590 [Fusibacter paucivorans]|uniref:DUF2178 domain-containing protein n=1 Tax=Fusibacter paucivorans TaxID=76009 RepID=A0ABS5PQ75_9FIRM|nr:hypothetical protein [Fusibacter paucivorans]MBS7527325.1 hypothetical protein [Fusibacter paucivorans]